MKGPRHRPRAWIIRGSAIALLCWGGLWSPNRGHGGVSATAPPSPPATASFNHVVALSFADQRHGWALGRSACPNGTSACLAFRQTGDGGRSWQPRPFPRAWPFEASASVLFATPRDGWLFGPALLATHDGGQTWQAAGRHGTILALAAWKTTVWSVERQCAARCVVSLRISADLGRTWRAMPPAEPLLRGIAWYETAQLIRVGPADAWLLLNPSRDPVLLVTHDGSRTWQRVAQPCAGPPSWQRGSIAALRRRVWLLCGTGPATGMEGKALFTSADSGRHWREVAVTCDSVPINFPCRSPGGGVLPLQGSIGDLLMTTPLRGWIITARGNLEGTWDGGRTWTTPLSGLGGFANAGYLGPATFADAQYGWVAALCNVYRTTDGGAHWRAFPLSARCTGYLPVSPDGR